jgi:glycosyltransferase involved in cell wall biosynthesis
MQPRIAFASIHDPDDISKWSGTFYYMYHGMRRQGLRVDKIAPLRSAAEVMGRVRTAVNRRLLGREYDRYREPRVLRDFGQQIAGAVRGRDYQLVFAPSSLPLAKLDIAQPKAFWTDSTFAGMLGFYTEFTNLSPTIERWGHEMERSSLAGAQLAVYSSDWATATAQRSYGADPGKLLVAPFGPNLDDALTRDEAGRAIAARRLHTVRLLFMGVDWRRKGGDVADAVAGELVRRGIPVELLIVGCDPPPGPQPAHRHPLGFISKRTPEGKARLRELFRGSHFLILPTIADCTPCVFSEANAFALPVLTTAVGGIPSVVRDGVNGRIFPLGASPADYADAIAAYRDDPASYRALAEGAFDEYATRLNWPSAIARVVRRLKELL